MTIPLPQKSMQTPSYFSFSKTKLKQHCLAFGILFSFSLPLMPVSSAYALWQPPALQHDNTQITHRTVFANPETDQQLYELGKQADLVLGQGQLQYPYVNSNSSVGQLYQQGKALYPSKQPHPLLLYLEAMAATETGDIETAQGALLEAIYYAPNFRRAQMQLVELYLDMDNLEPAQALLPVLMDLPENADPNVQYLSAHLLYKKGQLEEATPYFEQLFAISQPTPFLSPKREKIQRMMADSYRRQGQMDKALPLYQQLTQLPQQQQPTAANLWADFAEVLKATHNNEQALEAYQKAFIMDPASINPLISQARQFLWSKQLNDAFLTYETIARIAPTRTEFSRLLIDIAYAANQQGQPLSEQSLGLLDSYIQAIPETLYGVSQTQYQMLKTCNNPQACSQLKASLANQLTQGDSINQLKAALILQAPVEALTKAYAMDNRLFENPETLASLTLLGGGPLVYAKATQNPNFSQAKAFMMPSVQASLQQTQSAFGLIQAKQYSNALALSRQALDSNLFNGDTYLASALAQFELGEKAIAKQAYETAKTLGYSGQYIQAFPKQFAKLDPSLVQKKK